MNELTVKEFSGLPAKIEDLAKFVLIGREKLQSVRAEIRAIDHLTLATDVREQKLAEAQMLSGALLDAERKIGEFTLRLPTAAGGDRKSAAIKNHTGVKFDPVARAEIKKDSGVQSPQETQSDDSEKWQNHTGVKSPQEKPKAERIKELGFNRMQIHRFEVLAKNPEVVEQVKREAQENDDIPTRSRVLQLVKEKRSPDWRHEARRGINDAIFKPLNARIDEERLAVWFESLTASDEPSWRLRDIDAAINNLYIIRNYIQRKTREG